MCQALELSLADLGKQPSAISSAPEPAKLRRVSTSTTPPDFLCPITLELMHNPVILVDLDDLSAQRHCFEYSAIKRHIELRKGRNGSVTCPVTNCVLAKPQLVPDLTLKKAISEWAERHGQQLEPEAAAAPPVLQLICLLARMTACPSWFCARLISGNSWQAELHALCCFAPRLMAHAGPRLNLTIHRLAPHGTVSETSSIHFYVSLRLI